MSLHFQYADVESMPDKYLVWAIGFLSNHSMAKYWVDHYGQDIYRQVAIEVNKRNLRLSGFRRHQILKFPGSLCFCGKPGIYIVNHSVYCNDHKNMSIQRRASAVRVHELKSGYLEWVRNNSDKKSRRLDGIKTLERRRKQKA